MRRGKRADSRASVQCSYAAQEAHTVAVRVEKLFGGRSPATPGSTWPLRSQRYDFADLVQNGFCVRLADALQGFFERHFSTSSTLPRLRIKPPNGF